MDPTAGIAWWKLIGGCLAVFALLLLFLRLLGRLQGLGGGGDAELLGVHGLGPGRSVERIRWRESVYTVYRQDKGLVLLESEPFVPGDPASAPVRRDWRDLLGRWLPGRRD